MATIHVNRGGTNLGTFSEDEVLGGLGEKRLLPTDLGWREGMPSWQPLSQWTEFTAVATAASGASAAGAGAGAGGASAPPPAVTTPPLIGAGAGVPPVPPPVAVTPAGGDSARSGLPWEHRQQLGLVNAFIETVRLVLTDPNRAFSQMRTTGGIGEPLLFGVIGGSIGTIIWIVLSLIINSLGLFASMAASARDSALGGMFGFGVGGVFAIIRLIIAPICIVILLFVWSGIVHLCLMLVGGARKDFEATFRPLCFAYGSTVLFLILPCCGSFIALIWGLVADCIGLARSHEIDTVKAVLAIFLPMILCCGAWIVLAMMIGGFTTIMQHSHQ